MSPGESTVRRRCEHDHGREHWREREHGRKDEPTHDRRRDSTGTNRTKAETAGRTVRIDAHVHTAASDDASTAPEMLLQRASAVGLDGIVVTDHDTVEGARVVTDLASSYDLVAVSGCEVSTAGGHLLTLGVDFAPERGRPLHETARRIRAAGGLSVVPHPFQRSRHGAKPAAIDAVDGIEVRNAHTLTGVRNDQAGRFADREGYAAFGGSDAHQAATVGRAATDVRLDPDEPVTAETVLDAMEAGRTTPVGARISTRQYLSRIVSNATRITRSML